MSEIPYRSATPSFSRWHGRYITTDHWQAKGVGVGVWVGRGVGAVDDEQVAVGALRWDLWGCRFTKQTEKHKSSRHLVS